MSGSSEVELGYQRWPTQRHANAAGGEGRAHGHLCIPQAGAYGDAFLQSRRTQRLAPCERNCQISYSTFRISYSFCNLLQHAKEPFIRRKSLKRFEMFRLLRRISLKLSESVARWLFLLPAIPCSMQKSRLLGRKSLKRFEMFRSVPKCCPNQAEKQFRKQFRNATNR